jgi:hypothetical protein
MAVACAVLDGQEWCVCSSCRISGAPGAQPKQQRCSLIKREELGQCLLCGADGACAVYALPF